MTILLLVLSIHLNFLLQTAISISSVESWPECSPSWFSTRSLLLLVSCCFFYLSSSSRSIPCKIRREKETYADSAVNHRSSLSPSSNTLTSNIRYPYISLTRLFSAMDFRFDFVTIFLILDVAFVQSQGKKNSRIFLIIVSNNTRRQR